MLMDLAARLGQQKKEGFVDRYLRDDERWLLYAARGVDTIDRIVGPLGCVLQLYGSPLWQGVGLGLSLAELGLVKLPFMYAYQKKMDDFSGLYGWGVKESLANGFAIGGLIDIVHSYTYRTRKQYERIVRMEKREIKEEKGLP